MPDQFQPLMTRVQDALQRSIGSLRGTMTDLYPPSLSDGTISEVVTEASERLRASGVHVTTEISPDLPALEPDVQVTLYRVLREVLKNAEKHAQATEVAVVIAPLPSRRTGADHLQLLVTDNGVGIPADQLDRRKSGHLGLRLLRDRLERVGGTLTIGPRPEGGTVVMAVVPAR